MKNSEAFCTIIAVWGGIVVNLFGGWSDDLLTLIICMIIDFITGIMLAGIFKNSSKTKNGTLQSNASLKGLCKKGMILLFVLIANRLDVALGTTYIRTTVIIGFITNECISIIENAGLMGVPLPEVIVNAIDILKEREHKKI